jgi:hypothetical protein
MAVPYTFATATTSIPLSQLDSNFATTITLGNTAIQLGNTVTTLNNMTLANVTISTGNVTVTSASLSGNLTFTGTGNRITGDFTSIANGVYFQTSTANSVTNVSVIPNGTSPLATFQAYSSSDQNNSSVISVGIGTSGTEAVISSFTRGTGTALPLRFNVGGSERVRIDTSGNVGIGTTTPSSYGLLAVKGATTPFALVNDSFMNINYYSYRTAALHTVNYVYAASGTEAAPTALSSNYVIYRIQGLGYDGTSNLNAAYMDFFIDSTVSTGVMPGALRFYTGTNGTPTERMRIDSSGNVGIGTTSITHALTVVGGGSTARFVSASSGGPTLQLNATGTSGKLYGIGSMDSAASLASAGAFYIRDSTDGVTRFVIDTSGNVGIGTTSPNASAILDAQSTTKGVRFPNMTTTQKNAISSPAAGLVVFDTTLSKLAVYSGTAWQTITSV